MSKGALKVDKAIHTLFECIPNLMCAHPYGEDGRYITYYAEERLYLVFDLWYHGFFLVEAGSPIGAINKVNCDRLAYLPQEGDEAGTETDCGYFGTVKPEIIEAEPVWHGKWIDEG